MPNWRESMQQTFEYYVVDPDTWMDTQKLDNIKTCTINRDSSAETLGSAAIDITGTIGECYIRVYLITNQNGIQEKHPLGVFMVQTPSTTFDGKVSTVSLDAYTPLIELNENQPPIGFFIPKGQNIISQACDLVRDKVRAPVVIVSANDKTLATDFIANTSDTWLTFTADLIANAKHTLGLDEMGRILFPPEQDTASLQPVWTYDDGNSSILYPEITVDHDLYGIPNVVEVIYSNSNEHFYARVVNDDPNSPISTVNRGREIVKRITDPEVAGNPTQEYIQQYAEKLLENSSSLEYTVSYTHGYCPVRLGDCVRLNYSRAGIVNVKAKVISQSIKCEAGCPVTEKAVFTVKLWG